LTVTIERVLQDEPPDSPSVRRQPLALRAARAEGGNGRVYVVAFSADDGHGGTCIGSFEVCVPPAPVPGAVCVDDAERWDALE
jgi:hypothetical protein